MQKKKRGVMHGSKTEINSKIDGKTITIHTITKIERNAIVTITKKTLI